MKRGLRHITTVIIFFLLLTLSMVFAIDKDSPDYGITHKTVFNDSENCSLCHLYNKFRSNLIKKSATSNVDEEYEDDSAAESSDGGLGWFFGSKKKKKKKHDPYDEINISAYINQTYEMGGFVNDDDIMPHEFSKSITNICMTDKCHTNEELGPSHAVDVSPYKRFPDMNVPDDIPLNWDTDKYEEVITCGSCHNPHIDWLSAIKAYEVQKPEKRIRGVKYYKTYFLRVQDTEMGYYRLCKGCHGAGY